MFVVCMRGGSDSCNANLRAKCILYNSPPLRVWRNLCNLNWFVLGHVSLCLNIF